MVQPPPETLALLLQSDVPTLGNCLFQRGLRNQWMAGIAPVRTGLKMAGPAFTLRFIPAREDIDHLAAFRAPDNVQRRAIEQCPAGSVLVADASSDRRSATAGDLMIRRLKARGCAGIVSDGGFRDVTGIAGLRFPAFHRAPAPGATPLGLHPVDVDVPIGCAGVAVYPGDILVGDDDGVLVIPRSMAGDIAREGARLAAYAPFAERMIDNGRSLLDIFPPTDAVQRDYEEWRAGLRRPDGATSFTGIDKRQGNHEAGQTEDRR